MREGREPLRTYLAEVYTPRRDLGRLQAAVEDLRVAAAARTQSGDPVRHLQAVFLPGEETCLHLLEARTLKSVEQLLGEAGLEADRIGEADPIGEGVESSLLGRGPH